MKETISVFVRGMKRYINMLRPGHFPNVPNKQGYYTPVKNDSGNLVCPMCGQDSYAVKDVFALECRHCMTNWNYYGILGLKPTQITLLE
jgi:hypothetical protein